MALKFRTSDGSIEVDLLVSEIERFSRLRNRAIEIVVEGRTYLSETGRDESNYQITNRRPATVHLARVPRRTAVRFTGFRGTRRRPVRALHGPEILQDPRRTVALHGGL